MRKLIIALCLLGLTSTVQAAEISVVAYTSDADVTVNNLNGNQNTIVDAINSADGARIQAGTISADALTNTANPEKRWADSFNEWVITGLLPPTSASLTSTTTAGRALINNDTDNKQKYVEKDATAHTYTASKHTFVDLSSEGTYTYSEVTINGAEPAVASNSIRLARVSTDATTVSAVRDDRTTSISLASNEDQFRQGLLITVVTPDAITIGPGSIRHGTTYIEKTTDTTLNLGTAADYAEGVTDRGTSKVLYVAIDSSGRIRLTDVAPTISDTSSNTAGPLRYSVINSENWRILSWMYLDSAGSGNINTYSYSDWYDMNTRNMTVRLDNQLRTGTGTIPYDDTPVQSSEGSEYLFGYILPSDPDSLIKINLNGIFASNSAGEKFTVAFFTNDATVTMGSWSTWMSDTANRSEPYAVTAYMTADTTSLLTVKVRAGTDGASTVSWNGSNASRLGGEKQASSLIIEEVSRRW